MAYKKSKGNNLYRPWQRCFNKNSYWLKKKKVANAVSSDDGSCHGKNGTAGSCGTHRGNRRKGV